MSNPLSRSGCRATPGLDHIRSFSLFGLSDVKAYFNWDIPYKEARQEVISPLGLPAFQRGEHQGQLSPWNAIGEVFRYRLVGKGYTLLDLKSAQDWLMERQWKQVQGVIDVTSYGGETKEYHVEVDPYRLRGHGVTLTQLTSAISRMPTRATWAAIASSWASRATTCAASGLMGARDGFQLHDILADVVVAEQKGTPVRVQDVADAANIGNAPRLGIVGFDDQPDVVQGIVLIYARRDAADARQRHAKLDYIRANHILPPGMDIEPYYDRGNLVKLTTRTVMENLVVGMVLVSVVLLLFLGNTRGRAPSPLSTYHRWRC